MPESWAIFRTARREHLWGDPRVHVYIAVMELMGSDTPGVDRLAVDFINTYRNTTFGPGCGMLDQIDRFLHLRGVRSLWLS